MPLKPQIPPTYLNMHHGRLYLGSGYETSSGLLTLPVRTAGRESTKANLLLTNTFIIALGYHSHIEALCPFRPQMLPKGVHHECSFVGAWGLESGYGTSSGVLTLPARTAEGN